MYIIMGSGLIAAGLIVVSLLAWMFRSAGTPRWLASDLPANLLCIPVTIAMVLGAGFVFIGLTHGVGFAEAAALIGCAALLFMVRWFIRQVLPSPDALGDASLDPAPPGTV